jgi:pilus assembly protein CpaD
MSATDRKESIPMARKKSFFAILALGAALASGNALAKDRDETRNRGLDSINQPVVQRTDYVLDLATQGDGLTASEGARLGAWFSSLGIGYGDRVSVDDPNGFGRSRQDIAGIAADYGLLLSPGAPITAGAVPSDAVRVIVSRSVATVPNCPNHKSAGPSSTSPNYGCAINSNLAAMIADPSDLVLGQVGSGTGDATTASKAIKVYRETAPTGTKGLISDRTRGNQ